MNLFEPSSIIERLKRAGIWSKKSLGQHFLIDEQVLEDILAAAQVSSEDRVVEIGPGMGVLSRKLLEHTERVTAFEYDMDMVGVLAQDLPNLQVIAGDVLVTAPQVLASYSGYKVVANIPYQITAPLLRLFLSGSVPMPQELILLVQKEVGERIVAEPGKSGRGFMSILCQYGTEVEYVRTVPAEAFFPPPKVQSAVIKIVSRQKYSPEELQEKEAFLQFVKRYFLQPRKQLKNVMAGILGQEVKQVSATFAELGLPETIRAQELSIAQWELLYQKYNQQ